MTKEERKEFRKVLKECQDMNGDNAFDKLANFICENLEEEDPGIIDVQEEDIEIIERDNNIPPEKSILAKLLAKQKNQSKIGTFYSVYDYLPQEYVEVVRILNNGKLPFAKLLPKEVALEKAQFTVNEIAKLRNIILTN